jgi:hypothetical protein
MKNGIIRRLYEFRYFIYIVVFIVVINMLYAYATRFEKIIKIKETNVFRGKYGVNTIADIDGNIYSVENSWFYLFFNSTELYTQFDAGNTYNITGYGYRIPVFNVYPNIIRAEKV